jgi:phage baseplate assembly protein W
MKATYVGFTTVGRLSPPYTITDIELVKQDILNEFNTRVGERVMLPNFGSIIHELIMDPLDAISKEDVLNDVKKVIGNEPRVRLISDPILTEIDNGIRVGVELLFIPQHTADHLLIEFQKDIRESL